MSRAEEPMIGLTKETEQQFRVSCASFGEIGHHDHNWVKAKYSLAVRYAEKMTRDAQGTRQAQVELPFLIQTRVVSPWEKAEVGNDTQGISLDSPAAVGVDAGGVSVGRVEEPEAVAGDSGAVWTGSEPGVTGVQADADGEVGERSRFGAIGESYTGTADDSSAD